jgi:exportin-5
MQLAIVEPLLLFCTHAIRMHDGRCCAVVLRVFRSIVPEFHNVDRSGPQGTDEQQAGDAASVTRIGSLPDRFPIPTETAREIREFLSSEVLRACITSLHEPYFVDLQKELGSLIATILIYYSSLTPTPRNVLLSLPSMREQEINATIDWVSRPGLNSRQQRALVLDLLKDLKGVSISEMGKLDRTAGLKPESGRSNKKGARTKMAQVFMSEQHAGAPAGVGAAASTRRTPDLDGVAGLFNDGQ